MRSRPMAPLSAMRWVVVAIYFCGVVVYPVVGALVKTQTHLGPALQRLLPNVLLGAALVAYLASLAVEKVMLRAARRRGAPLSASTTAVIVSAFGEAISVLGLMLSLLGIPGWSPVFYGLCLAHGVHLALRWSAYQEIASGTGNESDESPAEEV